jgi:hypothetical protein
MLIPATGQGCLSEELEDFFKGPPVHLLFFQRNAISWALLFIQCWPFRSIADSDRDPLAALLGSFRCFFWATILIIAFDLVNWVSGSTIKTPEGSSSLSTYLYLSGTTFFTFGVGDMTPATSLGRELIAFEGGMGFGSLAFVIGCLPVLNQSFSRREVNISLLGACAGFPPTAVETLRRHSHERGMEELGQLLHDWKRWTAELLERHLSCPVLAYFRSQHDGQG